MDRLIIWNSDRRKSVTMPKIKNIEVGAEEVSRSTTMASGKIVKDVLGMRPTVTATWDWLPASTTSSLVLLLRASPFVYVEYPDPDGTDKAGWFDAEYPVLSVFTYKNGIAVWHSCTLNLTAKEVS